MRLCSFVIKCLILIPLSCSLSFATPPPWAASVSNKKMEEAKERYGFASWGGRTSEGYRKVVTDLDVSEIPANIRDFKCWKSNVSTNGGVYIREKGYTFLRDGFPGQWRLHTWEFLSIKEAHEMMIARFADSRAPQNLIKHDEKAGVGDRCYGRSHFKSTFWFCRNNLFVEVSGPVTNYVSCVPIAQAIDEQIIAASSAQSESK